VPFLDGEVEVEVQTIWSSLDDAAYPLDRVETAWSESQVTVTSGEIGMVENATHSSPMPRPRGRHPAHSANAPESNTADRVLISVLLSSTTVPAVAAAIDAQTFDLRQGAHIGRQIELIRTSPPPWTL